MKIKFRLAIIAVVAMISSMAWAQETFPVKTDKYGFYSVQSTPTSVAFIKASTEENEDGSRTVNIYRGRELAQSIVCDVTSGDLHFFDANFDGNVDILIGPGCNREYSTLILWDREENRFARASNDGFTVFNGDFYYEPERMAVYRMTSSSAFETTYTLMTWQGTDLQSEELFLQVFDPSYYDFYHVKHRYTVRGYYTGEDIGSDNPNDISEPWDKWVITWNDND